MSYAQYRIVGEALRHMPPGVLPTAHRTVLLCLADWAHAHGDNCAKPCPHEEGVAWPSAASIAQYVACTTNSARDMVRELAKHGWLVRSVAIDPVTGAQTSNRYRIQMTGTPIADRRTTTQAPKRSKARAVDHVPPTPIQGTPTPTPIEGRPPTPAKCRAPAPSGGTNLESDTEVDTEDTEERDTRAHDVVVIDRVPTAPTANDTEVIELAKRARAKCEIADDILTAHEQGKPVSANERARGLMHAYAARSATKRTGHRPKQETPEDKYALDMLILIWGQRRNEAGYEGFYAGDGDRASKAALTILNAARKAAAHWVERYPKHARCPTSGLPLDWSDVFIPWARCYLGNRDNYLTANGHPLAVMAKQIGTMEHVVPDAVRDLVEQEIDRRYRSRPEPFAAVA